jgi:hypothetical protein
MKEEEKADVLKQNGKKSNAKEALICHSGPAQMPLKSMNITLKYCAHHWRCI